MYSLISIATDNILASYAARFKRDSNGEGYRFIAGDYGKGVVCSAEQRDEYIEEFTQFIKAPYSFPYALADWFGRVYRRLSTS